MNRVRFVTTVSLPLLALLAGPALGQPAPAGRHAATDQEKLRLQIAAMEGVLATAVHEIHGRQLEKVAPGLFQFDGAIRARGFHLDGYGVFFDVDLPPLPRAVVWSVRMLDTPVRLDFELEQLRRQVAAVSDPRLRQELEQSLRAVQRKVTTSVNAFGGRPGDRGDEAAVQARGASRQSPAQPESRPAADPDPFEAYVRELGQALADLMVQYGTTITLGPDDWLTVAARESSRLLPGGPVQTALTLRVKGADLAAFKAGRVSVDEVRRKVEVREF